MPSPPANLNGLKILIVVSIYIRSKILGYLRSLNYLWLRDWSVAILSWVGRLVGMVARTRWPHASVSALHWEKKLFKYYSMYLIPTLMLLDPNWQATAHDVAGPVIRLQRMFPQHSARYLLLRWRRNFLRRTRTPCGAGSTLVYTQRYITILVHIS